MVATTCHADLLDQPVEELIASRTRGHWVTRYRTAHNLKDLTKAWHLVYNVYSDAGLIDPNPYAIHTTPTAATDRAAVFFGHRGPQVDSTLTAVVDGSSGLPLDCMFKPELDAMRQDARRLMECSLFAHRLQNVSAASVIPVWNRMGEEDLARTSAISQVGSSLINLMRLAFWYGVNNSVTDFVLTVPAGQSRFFKRAYGFDTVGSPRNHPVLNGKRMVLIHANLESNLRKRPLPFALRYSLERPIASDEFLHRVRLCPQTLSVLAGQIDGFLRFQYPDWELAA